jgi:hypothetical protein
MKAITKIASEPFVAGSLQNMHIVEHTAGHIALKQLIQNDKESKLFCIQRSYLGLRKNYIIRQLSAYLRYVDPDCQFLSIMILVLLLLEGNLLENMAVTLL